MEPQPDGDISSNPNKKLLIPKWVNEEYFKPILEKDVANFSRILNFQAMAATHPGENYCSIMVRAIVDILLTNDSKHQISYILKTSVQEGEGAEFFKTINVFPKELQMYKEYLPQFEKLYKEAGFEIRLGPRGVHFEETPERSVIVLEDLKRQGFKNIDRLKGMDMTHAGVALQKLAEFHAASAMYYELNGAYDEVFQKSLFAEENRPFFESMHKDRETIFHRAMRQWGLDDVEWYIENSPTVDEIFKEGSRLNMVDPNEFNVLNHGDYWANNVMFSYKENGDIDDIIMIDFQIGKWGSPAQDLWYFIVTSASIDIKVKEFDRFLHIYHSRLEECLRKLKYPKKIPTLKDIHILMLEYGYWGINAANGVLSIVLYPSDSDATMDNLIKSEPEAHELKFKVVSNPVYARACCQLYPFFKNKGLWKSR